MDHLFTDWLNSKNIHHEKFKNADSKRFNEWQFAFSQLHPESFTAQKKFLINPIRRLYPLSDFNLPNNNQ